MTKQKHWYMIHSEECVLCGRYTQSRERIYEDVRPKPTDLQECYTYRQYMCCSHY